MDTEVAVRDPKTGRFVKGQSGNPEGRPLSRKNQITNLKQDLEIALRREVTRSQVQGIINKMVDLAYEGNVGAAKLILDKVLSNAKSEEETEAGDRKILVVVKNVTIGADPDDAITIDVTPTEED